MIYKIINLYEPQTTDVNIDAEYYKVEHAGDIFVYNFYRENIIVSTFPCNDRVAIIGVIQKSLDSLESIK